MRIALTLIILWLLAPVNASATNREDTVCISGRVTAADDVSVEALIVSVLHPKDSSLVAYCLTDKEGKYGSPDISCG